MSKSIQAYFNTENEAEDAKILLQTLAADMLEVEETGEEELEGVRFIMPFAEAAGTMENGAMRHSAGAAILHTAPAAGDLDAGESENLDHLRYVLSGKVRDIDFDEAVAIIYRNHGHVQSLELTP
jgi:hypothetical protein